MKQCSKCNIIKELDQFDKKSNHTDGYNSQCKECRKLYSATYYKENKTRIQKKGKKYYKANKNKFTEASKEYRNRTKQEKKAMYLELKNGPCMDCGGIFDPECMDFDHRDGEMKLFAISQYSGSGITRVSMKKILIEVAKCDLVCANCHRLRTKQRRLAAK